MGDFKKINTKRLDKNNFKTTPEDVYWKKFGTPVFLKEFGPIDYIDFSPKEPYYFAVTSSVRVQVYSPVTRLLHKNLSRFQKSAYGGAFRSDGKLLCSGGEEAAIKLFDVSSKSLLRVFKGHSGPVHRCFFNSGNDKIASFSDDGSVGLWDIASEKRLYNFHEHKDYVRAGTVSPVCPATILSGGYDQVVKMYDCRSDKTVFSVKHDAPVESVLFLPSGGIFLSAGGTEIKVWDAIAGGRLLTRIHQHHKTVTCLCLTSNGTRFLSGALDRHVNVYDVSSFQCLHSLVYPNSVLSMGISRDNETLAVGMVDGLVSIRRRDTQHAPSRTHKILQARRIPVNPSADVQVGQAKYARKSKHELCLKRFDHTGALNTVLKPYVVGKTPEVTVSLLQELMRRQKLQSAIAGCEPRTILPLLRFIIKFVGDSRFTRILLKVSQIFMDVYEDSIAECGESAVALLQKLDERIDEEVKLVQDMLHLEGALSLLLTASSAGVTPNPPPLTEADKLKPSTMAQNFIVNVT